MSTVTPARATHRLTLVRTGLVIAVLLSIGGAIPAVFDIGFNGTGWDVVVVLVAILSPLILVGTVAFLPFAWKGRRTPALVVAALQLVAILPALPPYLHDPGELPPEAAISATIGIALNLVAATLIAVGLRPRR